MPLKNKSNAINENKNKEHISNVYFCNDQKFIQNKTKIEKPILLKTLKNDKPVKYSTVFSLDKENLSVTDEEIAIDIGQKEIITESLNDAKNAVINQKSKRTQWFNIAFFIINILILIGVLIYQLNSVGVAPVDKIKYFRWEYLIYAVLLFLLIMLTETIRTHVLIHKVTKTFRPFLSYKASAICRYYDCITPFTTGGEPFEIFYLHSRGLNGGTATSVPLAKSLFNSLAFIIVSLIVLICDSNLFGNDQVVVRTWGIISLCIACAIMLIVILFSISKKIMPKIMMFCLKLLHKMKLVKDYHISFNKSMRIMFEYQKSLKYYAKSVWVMLTSLISSGLIVVLKALIPFFIYCAYNATTPEGVVLEIFSKFILIELATKYIPLPGGSGVAEISFSALFASLFKDGTLFWAMLLYRVFNYFIYIVQGLIIIVYDFLIGNKKNRQYLITQKEIMAEYKKEVESKKTKKS